MGRNPARRVPPPPVLPAALRLAPAAGWLLAAVLALAPAAASAQGAGPAELRFAPADTAIAAGDTVRLSIRLDDPLSIRTIDVWVAYDTTVVRTVAGGAGRLFTDAGLFLWTGFEEDVPGLWHGYVVIMGADDEVAGPGELLFWEAAGVADGVTAVAVSPVPPDTIGIYLADVDGEWYSPVLLPPTSIRVGDDLSPVVGAAGRATPTLRIWPNPFNPTATVEAAGGPTGPLRVVVYDLRGRLVRSLACTPAADGAWRTVWDGRDDRGGSAPAGVYLIQARGAGGTAVARAVLVR